MLEDNISKKHSFFFLKYFIFKKGVIRIVYTRRTDNTTAKRKKYKRTSIDLRRSNSEGRKSKGKQCNEVMSNVYNINSYKWKNIQEYIWLCFIFTRKCFIPHFDSCFAKYFERSYENEHGKIQQLRHSRIYYNYSYHYQMFNMALNILSYMCTTHTYIFSVKVHLLF